MSNIATTPKIPTVEQLRAELRLAGAGSFTLDENTPTSFLFSCRDNGDVGDEIAGEADIEAARRAVVHLRKIYPDAKISMETVDEWVHINVNFTETHQATVINEELAVIAASEICKQIQALGFTAESEPIRHHQKRVAVTITTNAFLAEMGLFDQNTPINAGQHSIELFVHHGEPKIRLRWLKEVEGVLTDNPETDIQALFQRLLADLAKQHIKPIQPLWETLPYNTKVPKGAIKIGLSGYEGPWENSPYYELPDGNVLLIDGENEINILIPKENKANAIRLLGDFFPELPKNAVSLEQIIREITDEITKKITAEALEGKSETLASFGKTGKPHIAADDSIHFIS